MTKKNTGIAAPVSVTIALVIVAVAALWFHSGSIKVDCKDTSVTVKASYWADLDISYSEIDSVTYRDRLDTGERRVGVDTARLAVGTFQNAEFGAYTLYAYIDSPAYTVLTSGGKTIVIGMSSGKDAQRVFETLTERVGN